jgi:hypothetical protein
MKRPVHFDEADAAAAMNRLNAKLLPHTDKTDEIGVQARLCFATIGTFGLALVEEINRGTSRPNIALAVAGVCSNIIMTTTNNDRKLAAAIIQMVLNNVYDEFDEANVEVLIGREGGNA